MPFSIKRLTHLNRSQSLQGRKDNATANNKNENAVNAHDQADSSTTTTKSSKSASNAKQSKQSSKSKHNKDVTSGGQQQQPQPQSSRPDIIGNSIGTGNALMSSLASLHHHQQLQQQQQQQHVPPSFVIRNQTNIGSAFQPVVPTSASNNSKFEQQQAIPNSRSFDSNEIRRLTTNQSNVTGNPPPYSAVTGSNEQTLGEWTRNNRADSEETTDRRTPSSGTTKRVHYAAHPTFARASSLTGHSSASSHHSTGGMLNNLNESETVASKRITRQTSTTTPTGNSSLRNVQAANGQANSVNLSNSSSSCGPGGGAVNLPRGGEEVLINGGGHPRGRSSSKPSSSSSSRHYAKNVLYTSSSIDVAMTDSNVGGDASNSTSNGTSKSSSSHDSSRNNRNPKSSKDSAQANNSDLVNNRSSSVKPPPVSLSQQQLQQIQMANMASNVNNAIRSSSTTPLDRNYYNMQHANQTSLFDDDPGIMSEIETSATGFRRGNKIRASLPIVRTPSKSQDRSLGLVFLQFRSETKRALLPNEITSIDTVKALFVRSFPRQLTMEYLDHPSVRAYIHDPSKDMFYELEDLRDVKDRCIIRIYEQGVNGPQPGGGGLPAAAFQTVPDAAENYGYFSEPEFDSEFQSQHVHRKRFPPSLLGQSVILGPNPMGQSQYYGTIMLPPQYRSATLGLRPGAFMPGQGLPGQPPQPPTRSKAYPGYSQTLPRGTHLMSPSSITPLSNPFGIPSSQQAPPKPQRSFAASPGPQAAAGLIVIQGPRPAMPPPGSMGAVPTPSSSVPQHLAYHQSRPLPDRPYSVAGHYPSPADQRIGAAAAAVHRIPYPQGTNHHPNGDFSGYLSSPEHRPSAAMLAMHAGQPGPRSSFAGYPSSAGSRPFEAELANGIPAGVFPGHPGAGTGVYPSRNPSAVIDEESRARMHEMERQIASLTSAVSKALSSNSKPGSKPAPPPKPPSLIGYRSEQSTTTLSSDATTQLKQIRRRARDLRSEVRALKRFALQQTNTTKETLKDTCAKIKTTLSFLSATSDIQLRMERLRISSDRDSYNGDVTRLDKDLLELEAQVEELRSNVINRRCRVNMSNVESMALILSRASKTVADLKARYPSLAQNMKSVMAKELQQIEKEEKFLKDEPERLEQSLKRCKKLTGTLVTLKRLASVQEQRSSTNPNTGSPSQLLQAIADKSNKDNSLEESVPLGAFSNSTGQDGLMSRAKRMQAWRRSAHFRQQIPNNYKIDLCRGFASMPTIQEPNDNNEAVDGEGTEGEESNDDAAETDLRRRHSGPAARAKHCLLTKSYDVDLMEPHTIIQVTPATPSSTDSSKNSGTSNMLENLLDELQTFSKQSSIDSPSSGATQRSAHGAMRTMSSSGAPGKQQQPVMMANSDTITRKARSKSYSSLRANSEPPGTRGRTASIPDGTIDLDTITLLASKCGNTAAATAALMEKRFAQSRQELLEQRHQELLRKQRQLQEQYTRLQQLSRGQIPRTILNDLKKTGSESNLAAKSATIGSGVGEAGGRIISRVPLSSTVHGSLKNLASNSSGAPIKSDTSHQNGSSTTGNEPASINKKIFETDIL